MSWNQYIKKINDVCEVVAGQSPEGKYYNKEGEGLPFYQGKKEFTDRVIGEPTTWTTKVTKEAIAGDILMSVRAPVGPINLSSQLCCIGRGLAAIRATEDVNNDFLFYFLLKHEAEIVGSTGAVFNSINKSQIGNIEIPIPPLSEQKQIVKILDKAFAAIDQAKANIEKNMQNAKELFQSKLNEIFSQKGDGWMEKELREIGIIQTGTTPPTKDISNYGDYISFVKPAHFNLDGSIDAGDSMLSKSGLEKGRLFKANSVLMVCIGATIGKTGFVEIPVSSNQQINALTPSDKYIPKLLYYGLISPIIQQQVLESGKSAQATLPIINKSKWEKLRLFAPEDKSIQSKIVKTLDSLNLSTKKLEAVYAKKIMELDELKKSILQKAFAGELTNKEVVA